MVVVCRRDFELHFGAGLNMNRRGRIFVLLRGKFDDLRLLILRLSQLDRERSVAVNGKTRNMDNRKHFLSFVNEPPTIQKRSGVDLKHDNCFDRDQARKSNRFGLTTRFEKDGHVRSP